MTDRNDEASHFAYWVLIKALTSHCTAKAALYSRPCKLEDNVPRVVVSRWSSQKSSWNVDFCRECAGGKI
jgi:hypothetical protein